MAELGAADSVLFDALADHAPLGVFICDAEGCCTYANERLCALAGLSSEQVLGAGWTRALHPDDADRVQGEWTDAATAGRDFHGDYRFLRPDGGVRWVEASATAVRDDGRLIWVGCCTDLTARKLSDERYRELFEHASDAIFVLDIEGEITAINGAGESLTGYSRDELVGMNVFDLIAPENAERARETFQERLVGGTGTAEYQMISKGGTRVFVEVSGRLVEHDGRALGIEAIARNTSERHTFEQKLLHEALHDHLTGLPNRMLFHERLGQALSRATRSGARVAVMLLDLDGFKRINDSLGHAIGDELLVRLAPRLQRELRGSDSVARLGGDEFAFLFEDFPREQSLIGVAQRILAAVAEPFPLNHPQRLTASLGITIAEPSDTTETALSNADSAMYNAKQTGPGSFDIYDETMRSRLLRQLTITKALATALQDNQLAVHYQPIVSLTDGSILALEALARWNDPELGWIAPDEFIPIAEEHSLIIQLGQHILSEAAKQAAQWRAMYPDTLPLGVFINTSPLELSQPDFVDVFTDTLERHGTASGDIGIEITERALIAHDEKTLVDNLDQLTRLGVRISLDDFGTGYASLTAVKQLPLTALKIDRSFITAIDTNTDTAPITHASISLGHTLKLTVIAEGVESQPQADYLRQLGCDAAQGFHYGRAKPAHQAAALLRTEHDTAHTNERIAARTQPPAGSDEVSALAEHSGFQREPARVSG